MGSEAVHLREFAGHTDDPDLANPQALRSALADTPAVSSALVDIAALTQHQYLPVAAGLTSLFNDPARAGLPRGGTVSVVGTQGCVTLTLALIAEAMQQGAWVAVVDSPWLGLAALPGMGVPLTQMVMVERTTSHWGSAMAALVDGFDLVVYSSRSIGDRDLRRIRAHAREKGTVLIQIGERHQRASQGSADLRFTVDSAVWSGLGQGHGHLTSRQVSVSVSGRRQGQRGGSGQNTALWLPDASGVVRAVTAEETGAGGHWAGSDIDRILTLGDEVVHEGESGVVQEDQAPARLRRVQ